MVTWCKTCLCLMGDRCFKTQDPFFTFFQVQQLTRAPFHLPPATGERIQSPVLLAQHVIIAWQCRIPPFPSQGKKQKPSVPYGYPSSKTMSKSKVMTKLVGKFTYRNMKSIKVMKRSMKWTCEGIRQILLQIPFSLQLDWMCFGHGNLTCSETHADGYKKIVAGLLYRLTSNDFFRVKCCQCFRLGHLRRPSPKPCGSTKRSNTSTFAATTSATRAWRLGRRRTSQRRWAGLTLHCILDSAHDTAKSSQFLMLRPSPTPSVPTRPLLHLGWRSQQATGAIQHATRAFRLGHCRRGTAGPTNHPCHGVV